MKIVKTLYNQNKLCHEHVSDAFYVNESHDFSIRYVFSGFEQYDIGKKKFRIYPGNFFVINEGTSFTRKIYSDIPSDTFAILFSAASLRTFHSDIIRNDEFLLDNPFFTPIQDAPLFLETIYPFTGHMKFNLLHLKSHFHDNVVNELLLEEYMYHSLFLFYKVYKKEVVSKCSQLDSINLKTRGEIFKRLNVAKDFIISNFNQDITLQDISDQAFLSVPHLFRTFKQTFNCSPHQYLMKIRLENAKHLLANTSYSLNEIVSMIGLTCSSTFIKLYRKKYNTTPHQYRANYLYYNELGQAG